MKRQKPGFAVMIVLIALIGIMLSTMFQLPLLAGSATCSSGNCKCSCSGSDCYCFAMVGVCSCECTASSSDCGWQGLSNAPSPEH